MKLAFDDAGRGPALLLLHPFPFDRAFWARATPAFVGAGLRVIAPDLRGFGASQTSDATWTLVDQAQDVLGLLDQLSVSHAHVLGLSMGGYVALALAALQPQRLLSLVLAHTKATADTEQAKTGRGQAIQTVQTRGVDVFADGMLDKLLAPQATPELRVCVRALMNQPAPTVVSALQALRDRPDRQAELSRIAVPSLVLTGAEDGISTPEENRALAHQLPNAELEIISGAGHLSPWETPEVFASRVLRFVTRAS